MSITISKYNILDLADFESLCNKDDYHYPQVSLTPRVLLKYKIYRENCFVAYDETMLVGYAYGGTLCDTLYPQFMFVKESYRNRGVGKMLMERLEQESGCTVSMIFYHKSLSNHYKKQGCEIGTELETAIKQIGGEPL